MLHSIPICVCFRLFLCLFLSSSPRSFFQEKPFLFNYLKELQAKKAAQTPAHRIVPISLSKEEMDKIKERLISITGMEMIDKNKARPTSPGPGGSPTARQRKHRRKKSAMMAEEEKGKEKEKEKKEDKEEKKGKDDKEKQEKEKEQDKEKK